MMLDMRKLGIAMMLALLALPAGAPPAAAKIVYKHYAVRGETPAEIIIDIWRKRRMRHGVFSIADIRTTLKPDGRVVRGKSCQIKDFDVTAEYTITLPRHVNERAMDRRTRRLFRAFVGSARKHELQHRAIYRGCLRRLVRAVRRMQPQTSCAATGQVIVRIAKLEGLRCRAEHMAFDKREFQKSKRLPLVRQALADKKALKAARLSAGNIDVFAGDAGEFSASATLLRRHRRAMRSK